MFLGYELALHAMHSEDNDEDMDTTSTLKSFVAGAFGGSLYSLGATPIANYLRNRTVVNKSDMKGLFGGLNYTFARDAGGFAIYFGVYTGVRKFLFDVFEDVTSEIHAFSDHSAAYSEAVDHRWTVKSAGAHIGLSGAAGVGVGVVVGAFRHARTHTRTHVYPHLRTNARTHA